MIRKKSQLMDDRIEAEVLAKRGDPSAWEELPAVPPSSSPRPAWMLRSRHLELAAKFHVLSILHRLGVEANLALTQPDNVDIAALGAAGQAITIDVKTVDGAQTWLVDRFSARKHHYVVVVAFGQQHTDLHPRAYVVASETLQKFIARQKLTSVSLDALTKKLAALEAWQRITAEQAA
jgi:hypothetical protein